MYIKHSSKSFRAWLGAAVVAFAVTAGGAAFAVGNEESESYLAQARTYYEAQDYRAAFIELRNSIQADPSNVDARILMAQVYIRFGQGIAAQTEIEAARQRGASVGETAVYMARALVLQRNYDGALEEIHSTDIPDADRPDALAIEGDVAFANGNIDDASAAFTSAERLAPAYYIPKAALARLALNQGNLDLAEEKANEAIALAPGESSNFLLKGQIARAQGDREAAVNYFTSAIERSSEYGVALLERAATLIDLGELDRARDDLDAVYQMVPDHPMAHYLSAVIAVRTGDFEAADELLGQTGQTLDDFMPAALLKGVVAFQLRNYQQASLHLSRVLRQQPGNIGARRAYGATLLKLGDSQSAIETLLPLIQLGDTDARVLTLIGAAYMQAGEYDHAVDYLQQAAEQAPNANVVRTELALGRFAIGDANSAISELEGVLSAEPDALRAATLLALFERKQGNLDKALTHADQIINIVPKQPMGYNIRGGILMQQKKFDEARQMYETALDVNSSFAPARINLGHLARLQGDPDEARRQYQLVLNSDRTNLTAMKALTDLEVSQQNWDQAIAWAQRAMDLHMDDPEQRVRMARIYMRAGQMDQAKQIALGADSDFPNDNAVSAVLAEIHGQLGEYDQAVVIFDRLSRRQPDNMQAKRLLARAQWKAGRIEAARTSYRLALSIAGDDTAQILSELVQMEVEQKNYETALSYALDLQRSHPEASIGDISMGNLYNATERYREAIPMFRAALEKEDTQEARFGLYQSYMGLNDGDGALRVVNDWLKATDNNPQIQTMRANTYLQLGRFEEAARDFEQIADQNSDDPQFLNNLAYAYHKIGDPRAETVAEQAYQALPESSDVADTLGWILVDTDSDIPRGLLLLRSAADNDSSNPEVLYHYAVALAKNGRTAESRRYLQRALELSDDFEGADRARELAQELAGG